MGKIDEAYVEVTARTQGLDKGLAASEQKIEKFVSTANSLMAGLGITMGAGAVVGFLKNAMDAAGNLAEAMNKVEVTFGKSAKAVTGMAEDMAEKFGNNKTVMLDAASNFGLIAQGAGFSAEGSAKLSETLTRLADDAQSFFNVPLDVALEKIRAGLVGEAEPLRQFGVLLSEAAVKQKAVEMGVATTNRELTEQEKVLARVAIIQEKLAKVQGDHERTMGSYTNQLKKLRGEWENFLADVGEVPSALAAQGMMIGHVAAGGLGAKRGIQSQEDRAGLSFWQSFFVTPKGGNAKSWSDLMEENADKMLGVEKGLTRPAPQPNARELWFRQRWISDQAMWGEINAQRQARWEAANKVRPAEMLFGNLAGMGSALTYAAMFAQQNQPQAPWGGGHIFGGGQEWARAAQEHILQPEKEQLEVAKSALEELKLIKEGVSRINAEAKPGVILKGRE